MTLVVSSGLRRRLFFAGSADQDGRDAIERVVVRAAQMQHEYDDLEEAARALRTYAPELGLEEIAH